MNNTNTLYWETQSMDFDKEEYSFLGECTKEYK